MARFIDLTDRVRDLVREDAVAVVEAGAIIVRDKIVIAMEQAAPRTGELYFIPGTRTLYRASAPGEPPAIRTAVYRSSWQFTPAEQVGDTVVATAFTDLKTKDGKFVVGQLLEDGTIYMEPRSHVAKGVAMAEEEIDRFLREFNG